jgi:hypothetical protein
VPGDRAPVLWRQKKKRDPATKPGDKKLNERGLLVQAALSLSRQSSSPNT